MGSDTLAPTRVTYNTVLSACAKAGMHERAMQLYREMQAQHLQPDIFTLTSLLNACDRVRWLLTLRVNHSALIVPLSD